MSPSVYLITRIYFMRDMRQACLRRAFNNPDAFSKEVATLDSHKHFPT